MAVDDNGRENLPEIGNLMSTLLANPDMLQQAIKTAAKLKESGVLNGILVENDDQGDRESEQKSQQPEENAAEECRFERHRQLLQALSPYLSDLRREKAEILMNLLSLMELADKTGALRALGGRQNV